MPEVFRLRHPFLQLLAFGLLFHIIVVVILLAHGFTICYFPTGVGQLAAVLLVSGPVCSSGVILLTQILKDGFLKFAGANTQPLRDRIICTTHVAFGVFILSVIYLIILVAYLNLKPAIPLLNLLRYDIVLEQMERAMFGGILPTEYLITHASYFTATCLDVVYGLFSPFMFVSLAIALYYEGFSGGSLLVLAYTIGLLLCALIALVFPTFGPLFTHPAWFERFSGLPSKQLAAFLVKTVDEYAQSPGTVYACAGIAAMPSYHVYASVCGLIYWRHLSTGSQLFGGSLVFSIWISTFVLGWHYLLDGAAGIFLALVVMKMLLKPYASLPSRVGRRMVFHAHPFDS